MSDSPVAVARADICSWPPSGETLVSPGVFHDALRRHAPLYNYPDSDVFLATGWEAVAYVTQRPEIYTQGASLPAVQERWQSRFSAIPGPRLYPPTCAPHADGEDHRIKRAWGLRVVEPKRLETVAARLHAVCDELIDAFAADGRCDFRSQFADVLPVRALVDVMGLAPGDVALIKRFTAIHARTAHLESDPGSELAQEARRAAEDMTAFLVEAVSVRSGGGAPGFLGEIVDMQRDRDGEVDVAVHVAQAINLVVAGQHSTAAMLAHVMVYLCDTPGAMVALREDPELIAVALHETLRLQPPVARAPRYCVADDVFDGVSVPAGSTVWLDYCAANRDPARFADPDAFRLDRADLLKHHVGFGRGIHRCLGASLALLEGRIAVARLLARLQEVELDEPATRRAVVPSLIFRMPTSVGLRFRQAGPPL